MLTSGLEVKNPIFDKVKIAIVDFLQAHPEKTAKDVTIACYGLAFKPDIDDLRESPALDITQKICNMHSGKVLAIEPNIKLLPCNASNIKLCDLQKALDESDIHVFLVAHKEFKGVDVNSMYIDAVGII